MKKLLPFLLCFALLLGGCGAEPSAPDVPATADSTPPAATGSATPAEAPAEPPTEPPTEAPSPRELAQRRLDAILAAEGHADMGSVSVPEICQYPDLPTGCEAVAATIAINSFGYALSEIEFARDWLIRGEDIIRSFVGDPFEYGGAGIFPPGLCDSVQRWIDASGAQLAVFDVTGAPTEALYRLIDSGVPVVVWCTYYMSEPRVEYEYSYDGHTVYWCENEHCVCLYGYDTREGTVLISDPIQGKVAENAADFASIYDETGRMAMVLFDTTPHE